MRKRDVERRRREKEIKRMEPLIDEPITTLRKRNRVW